MLTAIIVVVVLVAGVVGYLIWKNGYKTVAARVETEAAKIKSKF